MSAILKAIVKPPTSLVTSQAFNVQTFGTSKTDKQDVISVLGKIAVRYDILLIQEIRDKNGQAIRKLRQIIKQENGVDMMLEISDRLGRTTAYKEQYAFLYRTSECIRMRFQDGKDQGISVIDSYHFDDGDESAGGDLFEREPFVVWFHAMNCDVSDFILVALHTAPQKTIEELKALTLVVKDVQKKWNIPNILILGDLNADCNYVPKRAWPGIDIHQSSQFYWPIGDEVDTTVSNTTDCAYDRFIVSGDSMQEAVKPELVKAFNFQVAYKLTTFQALSVSDHYPIELVLKDKRNNQHDTKSCASGFKAVLETSARSHGTITEIFQHFWNGIFKKLSRWRFDSEL